MAVVYINGTRCTEACQRARGASCSCSCAGMHHGTTSDAPSPFVQLGFHFAGTEEAEEEAGSLPSPSPPEAEQMQKQSDEEIERLDAASKPLRDAAILWARERDLGSSMGWREERRVWEVSIGGRPELLVEVSEDGTAATATRAGARGIATTPKGLHRLLGRLFASK